MIAKRASSGVGRRDSRRRDADRIGYPAGGLVARSTVNFNAGANTGPASLITVESIGMSARFPMPLSRYLPRAVPVALIIAVRGLMDSAMPRRLRCYNKADAAALIFIFPAVLGVGIEKEILIGTGSTEEIA